jgi:hypothetical protein
MCGQHLTDPHDLANHQDTGTSFGWLGRTQL